MNQALFFQIFNLSHKIFLLDQVMIFGAVFLIFITFLLTIILTVKGKSQEKIAFLLIILGVIVAEVLIFIIHLIYFKSRPFVIFPIQPLVQHAADAAFPSGHTTIMAVVAFAYTFAKSKWAPLFLILMLWVGFARIFVGVHYPLDILGGIIVGFISVFITWQIKNRVCFLKVFAGPIQKQQSED